MTRYVKMSGKSAVDKSLVHNYFYSLTKWLQVGRLHLNRKTVMKMLTCSKCVQLKQI